MRHLTEIKDGKIVSSTNSELTADREEPQRWVRMARQQAEYQADGIYRTKITSDSYGAYLNFGTTIKNPAAEIKRLEALDSKRQHRATTGAPGISGFQRATNAATAALASKRDESRKLVAYLTKLA